LPRRLVAQALPEPADREERSSREAPVPLGEILSQTFGRRRYQRTDLERVAGEAREVEQRPAIEAGSLGFMAQLLVQATLPHKNPGDSVTEFERSNGDLRLVMKAPPGIGLPWGKCPRLLLSWCRVPRSSVATLSTSFVAVGSGKRAVPD
jgi:hypothetical protein